MSVKQSLLDMGFLPEKIESALSATGEHLEQAMEWLLSHADDTAVPNSTESEKATGEAECESAASEKAAGEAECGNAASEKAAGEAECGNAASEKATGEAEAESAASDQATEENADEENVSAKSIKCDDCGKLFKNSEEVEFHAVKSGHMAFSESTEEKKALTEEEKRQKLKDLENKLKERRKEKEEEDRKEAIDREKRRIQMSREIADTKRRVQEEEMKRIAEERRREKMEDKLARQRVKEQIERDKVARKEMFSGAPKTTETPSFVSQPAPSVSAPVQKKDYDSTRIQIRFSSGSPLVQEFGAKESLSAVRLWISLNRKDKEASDQSFTLSTTFPRKIFSDEDMDKPLNILGLVPSAVLVVAEK